MKQLQVDVKLSPGVISFTSVPDCVDELIHEADTLMYKAKTNGKNDILFRQYPWVSIPVVGKAHRRYTAY